MYVIQAGKCIYTQNIYFASWYYIRLKNNKVYISTFEGVSSVCVDNQQSVSLQMQVDTHLYTLSQNYHDLKCYM